MATRGQRIRHTYEDYLNTPEGERYELLDGELVVAPSPKTIHQTLVMELSTVLNAFVKRLALGKVYAAPTDVVLWDGGQRNVVQPDVLFISAAREGIITEANVQGAPDLVVEILSPSTQSRDRGYKRDLYARHGVGEYWLVDPDAKRIEILLLSAGDFEIGGNYGPEDTLISPTLHGFRLNLAEIFGAL